MNQLLKEQKFAVLTDLITPERASDYASAFIDYEKKYKLISDTQAPKSPAKYDFLPLFKA